MNLRESAAVVGIARLLESGFILLRENKGGKKEGFLRRNRGKIAGAAVGGLVGRRLGRTAGTFAGTKHIFKGAKAKMAVDAASKAGDTKGTVDNLKKVAHHTAHAVNDTLVGRSVGHHAGEGVGAVAGWRLGGDHKKK